MNTLILDSSGNYKLIRETKFIPRVGDVVIVNNYPRYVTDIIWFPSLEGLRKYFPDIFIRCPKSLPNCDDTYEVIVYCRD